MFWSRLGGRSDAATLKKHAPRVADRRLYAPDRWESLQTLAKIKNVEAVEALLKRFAFQVDPTITDQEEKELVFNAVIEVGEPAVESVKNFLRRNRSIAWPLKLLERLLPVEQVVEELLKVLAAMDLDYDRDPQKKIEILASLEERHHPQVLEVVQRFMADNNETVRFHAVGALVAQEDAEQALAAISTLLMQEDSVRVQMRIFDTMASRKWPLSESVKQGIKNKLPPSFRLDAQGIIVRVASAVQG